MTEPVLRLESLQKNFGGLRVTDDVTLDILPGEMHAIIGPNGAGKTTLINQISGVLSSDAGHIVFNGRDITRLPLHARAVLAYRAFVPDHVCVARLLRAGKCCARGAGAVAGKVLLRRCRLRSRA